MTYDDESPYPGMNPYLEGPANWSDFHATFIGTLREAINERLPQPYYARIEQWVMMIPADDGGPPARRRPGVVASVSGATALLEPATMSNLSQSDPHRELVIEISRLPARDVVTVVELFSPTNKHGEGRGIYLQKRDELIRSPANVVEIDLLRAGRRLQLSGPLPPDDCYCFVSRGDRRPSCDVYHWSVRDRLPTLPIPLRHPDADLMVDLDGPFRTAFARGQYGRYIDYTVPPPPPALAADDARWLATFTQPEPS